MTQRPLLAVAMGDPAGIGPEFAVRAVLSPEVRAIFRCFIIGDTRIPAHALSVCGLDATLHQIEGPEDIADRDGTIGLMHQETADPAVVNFGKVQAGGGQAAYAAIKKSIDLAMAHRVDGVATTPINKELLKAAKVPFIGHTEMGDEPAAQAAE